MTQLKDHDPSTTGSTAADRATVANPATVAPTVAFRDLLQKDPTVCNHCFSRTHDAVAFDRYSGIHGWHTIEYWYRRLDRTGIAHHDRMTYGLTSSCDCGEIGGRGKRRPIDYATTTEYAENILTTLSEKGIGLDVDVFRDRVRELKRDPTVQGMEDGHVFAPALRDAIRHYDPDPEREPESYASD